MLTLPVRGSDRPCVLDDADAELARWKWKLNNKGYVVRNLTIRSKGQPTRYQAVILHRLVAKRAGLSIDGAEVDHEDRDKLNNRRSNLRVATRRQNCANTSLKSSYTDSKWEVSGQHLGQRQAKTSWTLRVL